MFHTIVWVLALFNILLVFCLTPPPRIYSMDFNDDKDELVVKWTMNNPNHSFKNFAIDLVTHSWNSTSCKSNKCSSFETIDVDYESNFPAKYLPATTFIGKVTSCDDDSCINCKLSSDEYFMITPPLKPEISAITDNCNDKVCSFNVLIKNETITNSKLYVLAKQKAEQFNLTNSEESIIFLNKSSIQMLNTTTNNTFEIDKSEYCGVEISMVAVNTFKSFFSFSDIKQYTIAACKWQYTALIILSILLVIIAVLVVLFVYLKRKNSFRKDLGNGVELTHLRRRNNSVSKRYSFFKRGNNLSRKLDADSLHELLTTFPDVKDILIDEYKEIPTKLTNLFRSQHGSKNRYGNILPYENNRVKIFSNPNCDYINASYIKGYSNGQKYIATQGPLRNTLDDFWGMIWDHNIDKIVMLTNFKEHGQAKCEEYWLENQTKHLINLTIVHQATKSYMDYKIRSFKMVKGNSNRMVTHYHFTSWMDDLIPREINNLIKFIRIIRESKSLEDTPIVVHCSAGVGRTGVFILCNYLLDMYKDKRYVDIPDALYVLRNYRLNMVKHELQYIFTYCLVNEILKEKTSEIKLETLLETMQIFIQDINLIKDIETTREKDYILDVLYTKAINYGWEFNMSKHRTSIPPKNCNGFISLQRYPLFDEESYYTTAVKIPNQMHTKTYISTIQPLPNTVIDFWRLVDETETSIILSLHDFFDDPILLIICVTNTQPGKHLDGLSEFSMLDQSGINALVLFNFNANNEMMLSKDLSLDLVRPLLERRLKIKTLRTGIRLAIFTIIGVEAEKPKENIPPKTRMRCFLCPRVSDRKTQICCEICEQVQGVCSSVVFWPTSPDRDYNPCNYLRVSFNKVKKYKGFVQVELCMYNTSKDIEERAKKRSVYVLHFHEWNTDSHPNLDEFIKYFKRYVKLSKTTDENATLIACSDGIKGCGLFLTFLYVIEKISHENIFDLCGSVNALRYYLDRIMTKPNEYKYIYQCVQLLYETENNLHNYYT